MFLKLEKGIKNLKIQLQGVEPDLYLRLTTLESRLLENIQDERDFGPSESSRNARTRIIRELNRLSLNHLQISFNDLCYKDVSTFVTTSHSQPVLSSKQPTSTQATPEKPTSPKFKANLFSLTPQTHRIEAFKSEMVNARSLIDDMMPQPEDSPALQPKPQSGPPSKSQIRQRLKSTYDDVDFDTLCLDHFEEVFDQFTQGMRLDAKINLLLAYCRRQPNGLSKLWALIR